MKTKSAADNTGGFLTLLVYFPAMGDGHNDNAIFIVFDFVDHSPIANSISSISAPLALQSFDVVVPSWISTELTEAPRQFFCQWPIGLLKKIFRVRCQANFKHRRALYAS
jgi:hypothetical protein